MANITAVLDQGETATYLVIMDEYCPHLVGHKPLLSLHHQVRGRRVGLTGI